jgi:outer membrane protein
MRKGNKTGWLSALAILLAAGAAAQPQPTKHEFSLQQAVDYGMKNAVQVKNALLDIAIQQQSNRDITSAALPQVTSTTGLTDYLDIPTTLLPGEIVGQPAGTFVPVKFGTKYTANTGVTLNQLLFDGQVFVGLQARKASIDYITKASELTQENIKVNIHKVYYQLVLSKTQIELLDANISRLEKLKHDTKVMYDNGFTEKVDIDKLSVQLANLQTEKQKVQNSVKNGYNGLKVLVGMPVKDSLVLTDSLDENTIKQNALESTQYQYKDRKDYQLLDFANQLNLYNIKRYKLSQVPTLSFNANYSKQAQRNTFNFFSKDGDWFTTSYIGLNLSIPIFKGFSAKAKIAKAKLEQQQTKNKLDNMQLTIDNDVETAKNNFSNAINAMEYQKQNMQLAETVYNQSKKKYEIGTGSSTDINAAQTDLKTAQTNYINALYDAVIAKTDLLKATGKL